MFRNEWFPDLPLLKYVVACQVDDEEVAVLQHAFHDLARRSLGKTIDKDTFTKVFRMPGILGDRLFAAFDRNHTGSIDYEEFIAGLGFVIRGSLEEKIDFVFSIYDVGNRGLISRTAMMAIVNSVMFAAYLILDASDDATIQKDIADAINGRVVELVDAAFANRDDQLLSKEDFTTWVVNNIDSLDLFDFVVTSSPIAQSVINRKGPVARRSDDRRSPHLFMEDSANQQLKERLGSRPGPDDVRFHDFEERIRAVQTSESAQQGKAKMDGELPWTRLDCPDCGYDLNIFHCCSCGCVLRNLGSRIYCDGCQTHEFIIRLRFCPNCGHNLIADPPVGYLTRPIRSESQKRRAIRKEGWFFLAGTMFKNLKHRWFMLKGNILYAFHSDRDIRPSSIVCLEGCFVEPMESDRPHDGPRYGLEIMLSQDGLVNRCLYFDSQQVRDDWFKAISQMLPQLRFDDYFQLGSKLGSGRFSSVCGCTHRATGKRYAVKLIDKSCVRNGQRELLRNEIAVLQLVHHPNIIQLKQVFESLGKIYIVLTLVEGGDLYERVLKKRVWDEPTAKLLIWNLLLAIQYMHDRGIVHRDIKPANIMMTSRDSDSDIQVADFGLSLFAIPDQTIEQQCGTMAYLAPEVILSHGYGREVDIWGVGVIMYLLLRGYLPFRAKERGALVDKIIRGKLFFEGDPAWDKVSKDAKRLLRALLSSQPMKRPSATQALKDVWFDSVRPPKLLESPPRETVRVGVLPN